MAYTIAQGDTLSGIAQKNKTTVQNLMSLNPQIKNPDKIYAGSSLAITPSSLVQKPVANVPTPPVGPNLSPAVAGATAMVGANAASLTGAAPSTETDPYQNLKEMISTIGAPPSAADTYKDLYNQSPIAANQADVNAKAQATLNAQAQLASVNARLAGISAEGDAAKLVSEGRLASMGAISGEQTAIDRQTAIRSLSLQGEALGAQAAVAAAQGNQALSQQILQQAQSHLDNMFQIQSKDAQNQYEYKAKMVTAIYDFADKQQKAKLDALTKKGDQEFELKKLEIQNNYAKQAAALKAKAEGGGGEDGTNTTKLTPEANNILNSVKNLRFSSVEESKRIQANIRARLASGDLEGAVQDLQQFGYEKMSASQKSDYDLYAGGISAFDSAASQLRDAKSLSAGPYKALIEKAKPYAAIKNDKAYTDLRSVIELGQAQIRKGFYGTAVTGTEAGNARNFLIIDSDTAPVIAWKLENGANFLQFANDATVARQVGLPKPKLDDYLTYRVKQKATGKVGTIPRSEYNSGQYEIVNK